MADLSAIETIVVPLYDVERPGYDLASIMLLATSADVVPPVVSRVSPPADAILSPTQPVVILTSDDVALGKVVVHARFADLALEEVVWNGERFASNYADNSTRVVDGLDQTFTIRRTPSWPSSPAIDVIAIDSSGNEGT